MMPEPSARKAALRAAAFTRRKAVSEADRSHFAQRLAHIALELLAREPRGAVAAYWPVRGEPDCLPMLTALQSAGFTTLLPAVAGPAGPLAFRRYRLGDRLVAGPLADIPQPPLGHESVAPDVVFVPCAAFDRSGHRIGFGRGFYDATLAELRGRKTIIALAPAFSCQEVDEIPAEPHDQALDAVITEREVLFFTTTGKALDAAALHR